MLGELRWALRRTHAAPEVDGIAARREGEEAERTFLGAGAGCGARQPHAAASSARPGAAPETGRLTGHCVATGGPTWTASMKYVHPAVGVYGVNAWAELATKATAARVEPRIFSTVSVWSSTQHAVVVDTLRIEGRSELFLLFFLFFFKYPESYEILQYIIVHTSALQL